MNLRQLGTDLSLSALAGYVGTKAMEPVSMKLYERASDADRGREDAARPGPPYRIAAEKISTLLGVELNDDQLATAGMGLHYGLAMRWAPLYPVLRRGAHWQPLIAGLATGAAMSVIADELMTPAFGFSTPNLEYPAATHVRGFFAHLAFGLAVAATIESGWSVLRRRRP